MYADHDTDTYMEREINAVHERADGLTDTQTERDTDKKSRVNGSELQQEL